MQFKELLHLKLCALNCKKKNRKKTANIGDNVYEMKRKSKQNEMRHIWTNVFLSWKKKMCIEWSEGNKKM